MSSDIFIMKPSLINPTEGQNGDKNSFLAFTKQDL